VDAIKLLLDRGGPVEAKDEGYGGTPLGWALHSWGRFSKSAPAGGYYQAVALLVQAGAKVDPNWYETNDDPGGASERIRSDPRMQAALRGEITG
jgi:hypothetical protein